MIQAGVQSYFAVLQAQDVIAQKQAGIITNPYMSFGTFWTGLSTQYRYGIAMSTKPKGVIMDIDRILKQTVDKDNKAEKVTAYNRATGPSMSLNENLVPEQLFDDPKTTEKEAQGISAVKALQIASSQGQTIYTVTKANYAEILPKLNHSQDVMTDVRNAINAGKEVTISQTQVHAFGWTGTGYIVLDPESGVGAYMIGGGADGGWTDIPYLSDMFLFVSTLLLAVSDFFLHIDDTVKSTWYISETLKQKDNLGPWSARAGIFGILMTNLLVAKNSDLSFGNKVGQIIVNTLAFGAVTALVPLLAGSLLGFGLLILATFVISYLAWYINNNIFTYRYDLRRKIKNKEYDVEETLYV